MCGINGIIGTSIADSKSIVTAMNSSMKHRGPDDSGSYIDTSFAFGQTRLSIIDLSSAGHQPMFSNGGKVCITFNGEIYNFKGIKSQLSDYPFITNTDTEVIIAAYLKWGIQCVEKLDGMFAFALHDSNSNQTFLVRDRLGVKPLYYYHTNDGSLIFASEVRSLLASGLIKRKLNTNALSDYLTFQTIPGYETLVEGVQMLPSGSYMTIKGNTFDICNYWSIKDYKETETNQNLAIKTTRELFLGAVEKRLMSDVPLGVFLSGGIDSSAVVAAMSECGVNINSYNINFNEKQFSEAKYAAMIAKKFKTNHTQIDLSADEFLGMFPAALNALDQPSWDGVNTYVVSKAVKGAGISVALSGVGGDEWFGGYPVFNRLGGGSIEKLRYIPQSIRQLIATAANYTKQDYSGAKKFELLASNMSLENSYYAIRKLFTQSQINSILNQPKAFNHAYFPDSNQYKAISIAEWENYLKPMLLRDTDQMGMAHALEIREPFLDYQLVEYVLSLPDAFKKGKAPKALLVDAMGDLIPDEIVHRPKMGFVLPWQNWLKNELKPIVNEGLDVLCHHPLFNANTINELRKNYYSNKNNIRWNMILNLAVLGLWIKNNKIE
jgi:asparagine synthase (glutamine-hydrolysing)